MTLAASQPIAFVLRRRDIGRDPPRIVASHPPDKREAVSAILLVGFVPGRDDTANLRGFM